VVRIGEYLEQFEAKRTEVPAVGAHLRESFAMNETTIILHRMLWSNRGAGENAEAAGQGLSGAAGSPEREALATDVQRGDLQNETCSQVLDRK